MRIAARVESYDQAIEVLSIKRTGIRILKFGGPKETKRV